MWGPPLASTILAKLSVIFGTVASFNIIMQNFYKVTQGNNEKVPSFAMRLEGTLNQIQLQCPGRMMAMVVQQHLKDCLFHGVCKHFCDSVWYLYTAPSTSYSQLMVGSQKAESRNEETQKKVRARAAVTTNLGEGTAELSQQIAKLMATLTQTRHGSGPSTSPGNPQEHGYRWGHSGRSTPSHPNSHNGKGDPHQIIPATAYPWSRR